MKRILSALLAVLLALALFAAAAAEPAENTDTAAPGPIATVNGAELSYAAYAVYEATYMQTFMTYGADMTDAAIVAYVQDMALTTAIEDMLVEQDMHAQGCYEFDEETDAWLVEQGLAAYQSALEDARAMMKETLQLTEEAEIEEAALAYAQELGVTEETYADFFRSQYATMLYYDWLNQDAPVTDAEIEAAYEQYKNELTAEDPEAVMPEMTEELRDQLSYAVYSSRCQKLLGERIEVLSESADVIIH